MKKVKSKKISKKLTPKQSLFRKEYLVDLNGTQAAIRAGYSNKTAYSIGQRLLKNVEIQKYIQEGMDKREKKIEISANRVLDELSKMAFANIQDYITIQNDGTAFVDLSKLTRDQAAALSEITVDQYCETNTDEDGNSVARPVKKIKIKMADKTKNLELLGRHLKLFTDKIDLGGQEDNPVQVRVDYKTLTKEDVARLIQEEMRRD